MAIDPTLLLEASATAQLCLVYVSAGIRYTF